MIMATGTITEPTVLGATAKEMLAMKIAGDATQKHGIATVHNFRVGCI